MWGVRVIASSLFAISEITREFDAIDNCGERSCKNALGGILCMSGEEDLESILDILTDMREGNAPQGVGHQMPDPIGSGTRNRMPAQNRHASHHDMW